MTENNNNIKRCKNCSAMVSGFIFCPQCGQKSDTHVLTFRELMAEFMDGLFNMDSRLWHSLVPLVIAPGKLTNEYLRGRRMYYLPPFRLYLILSVLFFLTPNNVLNDTGENEEFNDEEFRAELQAEFDEEFANDFEEEFFAGEESGQRPEIFCINNTLPLGTVPAIVFRNACLNIVGNTAAFIDSLAEALPVIMIATIPLIAFLMQLLYFMSGRRYVEHVVFMFHIHAFMFLVTIVMAISTQLGQYYAGLSGAMNMLKLILAWYIPIYVLLAMARVYGGGKFAIFLKAIIVILGYLVFFSLMAAVGALFAALNI